METQARQENKMGVMPVNRLLLNMSLPMMISMLVQALYNVVDSLFVARIGEDALTAVSLAFPVQNLMIAVGVGTGVGINALLSRCLGEKRMDEVDKAANNGLFLAVISYLLFLVFGLFFCRIYFAMQTDSESIISYGYQYLSLCTIFSIGAMGQMTLERLLQSTGKTMYTMITQSTGAVINIILDPIFIFGLLGMPKMGVAGAAVATVTGQICAMILALYFNIKKNHEINLKLKGFRPNGKTIADIYKVGIPTIIMQSIASIMTFGFNRILLRFTSTAAAVFGVYFKLQSFIFMPVFGLNNGMVPIISYNYGAGNRKRIERTILLSVIYAVSIMLVGLIIMQIFPAVMLTMFEASAEMLEIGVPALRTISLSFVFAGYCISIGSVFQSMGNGMMSLVVSVVRQLVVLLPVAYALSLWQGLHTVWWSFPISELAAVSLTTLFLFRIYQNKIKKLPDGRPV